MAEELAAALPTNRLSQLEEQKLLYELIEKVRFGARRALDPKTFRTSQILSWLQRKEGETLEDEMVTFK